jgi:hypothetical protein
MIEATSLTKRYATTSAVVGLTFAVRPGVVAARRRLSGEGSAGLIRPTPWAVPRRLPGLRAKLGIFSMSIPVVFPAIRLRRGDT